MGRHSDLSLVNDLLILTPSSGVRKSTSSNATAGLNALASSPTVHTRPLVSLHSLAPSTYLRGASTRPQSATASSRRLPQSPATSGSPTNSRARGKPTPFYEASRAGLSCSTSLNSCATWSSFGCVGRSPAELLLMPRTPRTKSNQRPPRQAVDGRPALLSRSISAAIEPKEPPLSEVLTTIFQTRSVWRKRRMGSTEAAQYLLTGIQPTHHMADSPRNSIGDLQSAVGAKVNNLPSSSPTPTPPHVLPHPPSPSQHIPYHPVLSPPPQRIPSHPTSSHPILPHPIPSHPIPSQYTPSHPIPSQLTPPHPNPPHFHPNPPDPSSTHPTRPRQTYPTRPDPTRPQPTHLPTPTAAHRTPPHPTPSIHPKPTSTLPRPTPPRPPTPGSSGAVG